MLLLMSRLVLLTDIRRRMLSELLTRIAFLLTGETYTPPLPGLLELPSQDRPEAPMRALTCRHGWFSEFLTRIAYALTRQKYEPPSEARPDAR